MSKERIVGFRASNALYDKLHELAVAQSTSISEILRDIILNNLDMSHNFSQWEIHAWNLFNINADQLNYARKVSKTPEHFFSVISKWSKDTKIRVIAHPTDTMIEFIYRGHAYLIQEAKLMPKIVAIQSIVDKLAEQIEAEVLNEATSLCDGTIGGDIPSTSEKQSHESESGVQESSGSKGHPDMSIPDDL